MRRGKERIGEERRIEWSWEDIREGERRGEERWEEFMGYNTCIFTELNVMIWLSWILWILIIVEYYDTLHLSITIFMKSPLGGAHVSPVVIM